MSGYLKLLNAAAASVGPIVLGLVVGWVSGLTRGDATVIAAVLPAVLATAGGIMFVISGSSRDKSENLLAKSSSILVAVFAVSFFIGSIAGKSFSDYEALKQFEKEHSLYQNRLTECSRLQVKLNNQRSALPNLDPLLIHQVCPDIPPRQLSQ